MKFLLTLLLGAFIGWMIRHRRWRHEMTHYRRAQLRDSVGGRTSLDRSDGSLQGSSVDASGYPRVGDTDADDILHSVDTSAAEDNLADQNDSTLGTELQTALDEKTAQHDKLQGLLFDLHEKAETLQVKNEEVNALALELSAAQTRIGTLESKLIDSEDAIDASRNRSEYISELEKRLEDFESGVQKNHAPVGKVAELERDIEAKNREIVRLAQEVDEVSKQQQTHNQSLQEEHSQHQEAQRIIKQQAVQIEGSRNLSARLAEKEKTVIQLQRQVAQLDVLQADADDLKSKLAAAEVKLHAAEGDASKLAEAELQRLGKVTTELEQSKQHIESLSQSLSGAKKDVGQAQQNDLELRRLRSECQSLQHERSAAAEKISSLEGRLARVKPGFTQAPGAGIGEIGNQGVDLGRLEADLARRDSQIAELKQRLAGLSANPAGGQSRGRSFGGGISGGGSKPQQRKSERAKVVALFKTQEQSDNLKLINGIGPVMEQLLNELGVTTFKQLAGFSKADIDMVSAAIDVFPGRIERDNWVGGAREQYTKKYGVEIEA